ncbi:hypothetical protein EYF80_022412 [Liparis tanakae]|uniref:Uncharacterized protein n=1 Tax=Liparis tanakae TaxID=230148 RepID=A0A4Z2HPX3_9TELE|nr:hypothetical protein EYF80_022412 [Liparis tanakae]
MAAFNSVQPTLAQLRKAGMSRTGTLRVNALTRRALRCGSLASNPFSRNATAKRAFSCTARTWAAVTL